MIPLHLPSMLPKNHFTRITTTARATTSSIWVTVTFRNKHAFLHVWIKFKFSQVKATDIYLLLKTLSIIFKTVKHNEAPGLLSAVEPFVVLKSAKKITIKMHFTSIMRRMWVKIIFSYWKQYNELHELFCPSGTNVISVLYLNAFTFEKAFWKVISEVERLFVWWEICKCKYYFPRTNVHWWIAHIKSTDVNYESTNI